MADPPWPAALDERLAGYSAVENDIGHTASRVFHLTRPGHPTFYLKCGSGPEADELRGEAARARWLSGHLPVPTVHALAEEAGLTCLLMSEIPGTPAHKVDDPARLIPLLAAGLRRIHALPIAACPFDHDLPYLLAAARLNVAAGRVDEADFEPQWLGHPAADLFAELEATAPTATPPADRVFTHGDYCLPNILIHDNTLAGFVDLGRAGVSDLHRDLALAARSLVHNFGPQYVPTLWAAYGRSPDPARLRFYTLLDEFF